MPLTGSQFAAQYAGKSFAAWEAAAVAAAQSGGIVPWSLCPVTIEQDGRTCTFWTTSDYFAVGTFQDYLRLPLTPETAQKIGNLGGFLLPTPKMVLATWRVAEVKLAPHGMVPNQGANMNQFVAHNRYLNDLLASSGANALRSGLKKDVVMGKLYAPGKVLIYGWISSDPGVPKDVYPTMTAPWRVQSYSSVHGNFYFDYSHGIRFIAPTCTVDGQTMATDAVLQSPQHAALLSDEGALKTVRYPTSGGIGTVELYKPGEGYAVYGLKVIAEELTHPMPGDRT